MTPHRTKELVMICKETKPAGNPIKKIKSQSQTKFELFRVDCSLELWAFYGEWVKVGHVSCVDGMGEAIANHEYELRLLCREFAS